MGNLFDYVDWRADVPFKTDPFNEADNLLLSELAYVDYEGIVPGPEEEGTISLDEVCDRFWSTHTEEEERNRNTFYRMAPFLLQSMRGSARFSGIRLGRYVNRVFTDRSSEVASAEDSAADGQLVPVEPSPESDSGESVLQTTETGEQMSAVTYYLPDGTIYVAYRGTDSSVVGWKEDFYLSFLRETGGQRQAAAYLSGLRDKGKRKKNPFIRVGGHSKGGNFAVFAAAFCEKAVQDRILEVYTNDGPGFLESTTQTEQYQAVLPRIHSIVPEESVFGMLLHSGYPQKVIESSEKGIMQHDALSWEILRNHFVEAPGRTEMSLFTQETLDKWISGIPVEKRRDFVLALFGMIEGTGAESFEGLPSSPVARLGEFMRSYVELGDGRQKILRDTLASLVSTSAETLAERMQKQLRDVFQPAQ